MVLNVSLFQNMELELEKCRTSEDAAKIDVERLTMTKDGLKKKLIECKGKLEAAITSRQQVMQVPALSCCFSSLISPQSL